MQTDILWKGIEYNSLENCVLTTTERGLEIDSVIVGSYHNTIYRIEYLIRLNENWETIFFELKTQLTGKKKVFSYNSDGKGNWKINGATVIEFKDCIDIDISLTPFTNSLPINRLKLPINGSKQINVLYLDILNEEIKPVRQHYTRVSLTEYKFENVPNDFEAIIKVDNSGFVVNYPNLFVRQEIREF